MKATILTAFTLITLSVSAQTDSTQNKKQDTIKIGNMVIVGANGTKEVDKVSWNHDSANKRNKRNK